MAVKIAAAMPKADHNGLAGREDYIVRHEGELVALVVFCEVSEVGRVVSTDEPIVKLRMSEVEIIDREEAVDLLRDARKERTGVEELDFDGLGGGDNE